VIFTNDGRYLVPASDDKTVRFWDMESGETVRVLRGQNRPQFRRKNWQWHIIK
jgi:WD40 repeat protein